ncbi:TBC1 domain family member 31-like [Patiria miniata]|uniref:TBC1 domain family member 31 n=1 Tax=Patiria miniata TaxID=46514 RepID=A0A914B277_PATMI|nr:TBC1 domain family member 31-like [Patiria miniata]XP_038069605.1 TBC1 domain family member 31-like [Patiria miniata]XP_038069606.1 TBC1 domain family member 31-like [Patiria miniata]XP_038069607.1 TBC1 domain family member 31-like [Patiria miniata]XP_038069608.1 TBC1 domain family member 31-like [Patiria miniata]
MQTCDVNKKEAGKIWLRKPSPSGDDGLMIQIKHDVSGPLAPSGRRVRFLHTAFNNTGDSFIAGDHLGNIYIFDLSKNRFQLVQKTGQACTSLAFTLRRKTEYLAALADCSLKCFDTDSKELVAWMKGHTTPIHSVSVHASGRYALTTSSDTSLLWDLDTFTRKRKLNVRDAVGISKVFFLPLSNTILTCFRDDSIFAWESDTLQCKYQLPIPPGDRPHYKAFATPRDGRLLVAGGKSRFLHVWALDTRHLLRVIEMPTKVHVVKQVEFLPESFDGGSSQVVGALSQDGIMRFINVTTCTMLCDLGSLQDRVVNVSVSPAGRHVAAVVDSGCINVYSVPALMSDFNKPPPALVKVASGKTRKRDTSSDTTTTTLRSMTPGRLQMPGAARETPGVTHRVTTGVRRRVGEEGSRTSKKEEISELPEGLDLNRLHAILKGYGEYPAKYRMFIWRSVLRLPENHTAFSSLVDKGTHIAWAKVHETYPIKSRKLLRVLQRTLSALAHWSAVFGEADFLPLLTFPFVKLFQNNQLICFEVLATVLSNWCQLWFEFFPNPPVNVLSMVENVLAYHDRAVLQHFVKYGVTSQVYAWPLLQTLLSEVVTKEEWQRLFDNIFTNHPAFLLIVVVAYIVSSRQPLLQCTDVDDFKYFVHHRNAVHIGTVISEAYRLWDGTPDDIHPKRMLDDFKPLTKGQYPIFNKYPKFIVDYQAQERERIRQDELEFLHQRQAAAELKRELDKRQSEETAWYRQQKLLRDAEEQRRSLVAEEEQKLIDQRVRLQAMKRELHIQELQLLDGAKRKFMHHQQTQKEAELSRLDDEIARKSLLREQETKAAMDDVEIRRMELQAQKQLLEQDLAKGLSETTYQERADAEAYRRQAELEERVRRRAWEDVQDKQHATRKQLQTSTAKAEEISEEAGLRRDSEYRRRMDDLERQLRNSELSRLHDENHNLEEEIQSIMKRIAGRKLEEAKEKTADFHQQRALSGAHDGQRTKPGHQQGHVVGASNLNNSSSMRKALNDFSSSEEDEVPISLDRGRDTFEQREKNLMRQVQELRKKIAMETRQRHPPPTFDVDDGGSENE